MNKIGLFLLKFNGFFAFLVLEIFSLYIYFTQNITPEKSSFLSSANQVVGSVYDYSNRWSRYWNLATVNDSLAKENARLKMQLPSSQFSSLVDTSHIIDQKYSQRYRYTESIIINNSTNRLSNYLTLNRGSQHGIRKNTGVVNGTGEGLIGIVRAVTKNYAAVMSILHEDAKISAKIKRNNYFGVMRWDGKDIQYMTLEAIPKHAQIQEGDTIVTSGFSTIFPEGVMIGTVDTFYIESGSNFYTTQIELAADLNRAKYVYIIDDLMRDEQKKLEEEVQDE